MGSFTKGRDTSFITFRANLYEWTTSALTELHLKLIMKLIRKLNAVFFIGFFFRFSWSRLYQLIASFFFFFWFAQTIIDCPLYDICKGQIKIRIVSGFCFPFLAWPKSYFRLYKDSAKRETTMTLGSITWNEDYYFSNTIQ